MTLQTGGTAMQMIFMISVNLISCLHSLLLVAKNYHDDE